MTIDIYTKILFFCLFCIVYIQYNTYTDDERENIVTDKKIIVHFTVLTFCIAYLVSGSLIVLGKLGYRVYSWVNTLPQFCMDIPFAIYILSPAIASYIVLKKNSKTINLWKWSKTVFYVKNNVYPYVFVVAGLVLYFSIHALSLGRIEMVLPFYAFFLSIPGNLFIGGLEETGWAYILQPALDKRFGYILSCIITGIIWIVWHIPLFFIPGTTHEEGLINFGMFAVQCIALRFFFGAICKISGKSYVFMCVLFHTLFNAASSIFATMITSWIGTIAANTVIIFVSILVVLIYDKKAG